MDRTDLVLTFVLLLLLLTSVSVGFAFLAEWYTRKALRSYARFQGAKGRLQKLENEINHEASKWPIYARPVLFTSVDKNTQRTFGIAQQTLMEAQRIAKGFPPIPLRPTEALEAFSPIQCAKRILHCNAVIQQEAEFARWLGQLEKGREALTQHYKDESKTLKEVEEKLRVLKERLSTAENKVAAKEHGEAFNETVGWVINYAQIGTHASDARLAATREKGLLNYAIADTFIRLTNYLLELFDLSAIEISFSEKFVLDRFENRLKDFEINLRKVIEAKAKVDDEVLPENRISSATEIVHSYISADTKFTPQTAQKTRQGTYQQAANAMETWDDVTLLDSLLVVLRKKLERASSSFSFFLKTQTIFLDLTEKIAVPNIPRLQEESLELETECEKYWGALNTIPLHWKEALQGLELPSVEFNAAKELFRSQILHHIKPDSKVKQSEMTGIISRMTCFLVRVENGRASFKKLFLHLKLHKDAEIIVLARLGDIGTAGRLVREMELFKNDYSEENRKACVRNRDEYNDFLARAKKITGANFPVMLSELNIFERKCSSLISKHNQEIRILHQRCENHAKELSSRRNSIEQFKEAVPRIKYDYTPIEAKITSTLQKDYITSLNYQWLQNYLKEASDIMGEADQAINHLNAYWGRFVVAEKNAAELLTQNQAVLDSYQNAFSMSWAWVKEESTGIIENAKKKTEELFLPLSINRDPQFNMSIEVAIQNCQKIKEEIENLNLTALGKLRGIDQQQEEYLQRFNSLMNMIDKPIPPIYYIFQVKPKVPAKLKELCFLATQVDDRRQVRSLLNAAEAYFEKQLTEEEAEKLIQDVHINYGTIIGEQNNQAGATVNNAGRDINYYDN